MPEAWAPPGPPEARPQEAYLRNFIYQLYPATNLLTNPTQPNPTCCSIVLSPRTPFDCGCKPRNAMYNMTANSIPRMHVCERWRPPPTQKSSISETPAHRPPLNVKIPLCPYLRAASTPPWWPPGARPPEEGKGFITIRRLCSNSLRNETAFFQFGIIGQRHEGYALTIQYNTIHDTMVFSSKSSTYVRRRLRVKKSKRQPVRNSNPCRPVRN